MSILVIRTLRLGKGDFACIARADGQLEMNDGTSRLIVGLEENLGKTVHELAKLFADTVESINESSSSRINRN